MADYEFKAPDGSEIAGTRELIPGFCAVGFEKADPAAPGAYDHFGGTDIGWDGQATVTIDGVAVFDDEDGGAWLAHHLIPADAEPLSPEALEAINRELRVGFALEAAQTLCNELEGALATDGMADSIMPAASILATLRGLYAGAKLEAGQAKAAELAAQSIEAEKAATVPETWPVQPIEPGSPEYADAEARRELATCGACGRSWDDGKVTGMTPAPAGRCPFEQFHPR